VEPRQAEYPQQDLRRVDQLSNELDLLDNTEFAYDFETYGLRFMERDFWIRCVSFHNDNVSIAVELSDSSGNYYPGASALFDWLTRQQHLIAHNAGFEQGVLYSMTDKYVPHTCTYALAAHLMNEGAFGQGWGLKQLGKELLGWPDWSKDIPKSAEMARLPFDRLGWYNQLDSAATWEIYKIFRETTDRHGLTQVFSQYEKEDLETQLKLQHEAYTGGLYVDREYITEYMTQVEVKVRDYHARILDHPDIRPYVQLVNQATVQAVQDALSSVPQYTKKGEVAKRYILWQNKLDEAQNTCHFNINSTAHLRALLYDHLECTVNRMTDGGEPSTDKKALAEIPVYGKLILEYRDQVSQLKFLQALLDNETDGVVRISVKVPGTYTSRLSAGSLEGA
jgi:DNA polymerase I-like protein with 3'-5' exonuclease and polymerase domains